MSQPIPIEVPPSPVPWQLAPALGQSADVGMIVVWQIFTPTGSMVLFDTPADTLKRAAALQQIARQATSGIITAPASGDLSSLIGPPPKPNGNGR